MQDRPETKKIKEEIIKTLIKIAREGGKEAGAIVVLGGNPIYKSLKKKKNIKPFYILDDVELFENRAMKDGATIVDENGILRDYAVILKCDKVVVGCGTRNSASISASLHKGVICVFLSSANEKKVKIFKKGKLIMQIDALEKGIEKKASEINKFLDSNPFLESVGFGTIGSLGATAITTTAGVVGISFIPGVLIFGGLYALIKNFPKLINREQTKHL
jgi:hypothetical protein